MSWPDSELEYQAAFFSINDNNEKPSIEMVAESVSVEDNIKSLKEALG